MTSISVNVPRCNSEKIAGLMAAFWVSLTPEGDMRHQWSEHESSTEVGSERSCDDCGFEWDSCEWDGDGDWTSAEGCLHPWHDNPGLITPCPGCGMESQIEER